MAILNTLKIKWFLAPTLEVVNSVNEYVISLFPDEDIVHLRYDSMLKVGEGISVWADWLTMEFF